MNLQQIQVRTKARTCSTKEAQAGNHEQKETNLPDKGHGVETQAWTALRLGKTQNPIQISGQCLISCSLSLTARQKRVQNTILPVGAAEPTLAAPPWARRQASCCLDACMTPLSVVIRLTQMPPDHVLLHGLLPPSSRPGVYSEAAWLSRAS